MVRFARIIVVAAVLAPGFCIAQTISTFAGNGFCGSLDDGQQATNASILYPSGGVFDQKGNYYFPERQANVVREIAESGIIKTIVGTGIAGFGGDDSSATTCRLNGPVWVAVGKNGCVYIADINNNRIRKVDTAGIIHTIAGNGSAAFGGDGAPSTAASLLNPVCVAVDDTGNVYELETTRIRKIGLDGKINTIVGTGVPGFNGDGLTALTSQIHAETFCFDHSGNIYISDLYNYRVRKVDNKTTIVSTVAGNGTPTYRANEDRATDIGIQPFAVGLDAFDNLYIADDINQRILMVNSSGYISTFAGTGVSGFSGDGGMALGAQIYNAEGIAFDSCGNIYFTDCENCRIRKISFPHCNYLATENVVVRDESSVYPNPVYNELHIDDVKVATKYNLLGITGATLQRGKLLRGNNTISMQCLPAGMYLLELMNSENEKTVMKIVKE